MASTPPPNVPPSGPKNQGPAASSADFSMGIFGSAPSSGGSSAAGPTGNAPPPPPVRQPPSANDGMKDAQGFTTHIPQLRNTFAAPPDNADHSEYYASMNAKKGMAGSTKAILVGILVFCAFFG